MKIQSIELKNFASYGNKIQRIEFDEDNAQLFLTIGKNGEGKCLSKKTLIDIHIEDVNIRKDFLKFLENK
jgi:predicted ATP-binding protein involved in virulence